jgi:hypothetical protein
LIEVAKGTGQPALNASKITGIVGKRRSGVAIVRGEKKRQKLAKKC